MQCSIMRTELVLLAGAGTVIGFTLTMLMFQTIAQHQTPLKARTYDTQKTKTPHGSRLLCWILTQPKNFMNKTKAVKDTWSKRCDITLFFSSVHNKDIPTVRLDIPEGRNTLAKKSMSAVAYIYNNYYDVADWFYKADDDTYVIVENLRHFLSKRDRFAPFYYGRVLNGLDEAGYNSGGAGYLIGKEGLKRLAVHGASLPICNRGISEDLVVGRCLRHLGIGVGRASDAYGRPLFNFISPNSMINGHNPDWAYGRTYVGKGVESVSPIAASFHYVGYTAMRTLDFLLYNVTVHGYRKPTLTDLL